MRSYVLLALLLVLPAACIYSQVETFTYNVVVTTASGPQAASFPAGEKLVVSYTLNPAATDSNTDPKLGYYSNAVQALSVNFPNLAISALAGPSGPAQTFNNVIDTASGRMSDQVFFFGGPISSASSVGGSPITGLEVDFLSNFVIPPPEPMLLTSDALPLFKLNVIDAFVIIRIGTEYTYVHFAVPATQAALQMLAEDVQELMESFVLTQDQADGLIEKLQAALESMDRNNPRPTCNQLDAFINQVNAFVRNGTLTTEAGQSLVDAAMEIRGQLGC